MKSKIYSMYDIPKAEGLKCSKEMDFYVPSDDGKSIAPHPTKKLHKYAEIQAAKAYLQSPLNKIDPTYGDVRNLPRTPGEYLKLKESNSKLNSWKSKEAKKALQEKQAAAKQAAKELVAEKAAEKAAAAKAAADESKDGK